MPYNHGRTDEQVEQDIRNARIGFGVAIAIGLIFWFLVLSPLAEIDRAEYRESHPTMDALTFTYTNDPYDAISIYTITDPDTGQQYLVSDHGGITPRLGYSPA